MVSRPKYWLFNVRDLHKSIEYSMSKYLGVGSFSNNYINIIVLAFEECLCDVSFQNSTSPLEVIKIELESYGITKYEAEEVYPYVITSVKGMTDIVRHTHGEIYKDEIFLVDSIDDNIHVKVIKEPGSINEQTDYLSTDKILKDIEEGHYVPEKIRMLHGLV